MRILYAIAFISEQLFHCISCLTYVQHSGYSLSRSSKYKSYTFFVLIAISVAMATAFIVYLVGISEEVLLATESTIALAMAACFGVTYLKKRNKYKFTGRSIRLFLTSMVIAVVPTSFILLNNVCLAFLLTQICTIVMPLTVRLILRIINPYEERRNKKFIEKAKRKLSSMKGLTVIAITGSYGKTSCKNILAKLLSGGYTVYATEKSYNTPMGIAKSIHLMPENTEIFIVEFGARYAGDIDELLSIVSPKYGIIVGIAPQHLDTFLSIENIAKEKAKLASVCKTVIVPSDELLADEVSSYSARVITVGVGCDVEISDIERMGLDGYSFSLTINGQKNKFHSPLLGEHNIMNMALCVSMATEMGVNIQQLLILAESVSFAEHRMQLIDNGKIRIIDDSYNANIEGVRSAAAFLKTLPDRKICVLQGIVECGGECLSLNSEIGERFAEVADIIYVLGRNSSAIEKGVRRKSEMPVVRLSGLSEVKRELAMLQVGDIVYLQNDLGDLY